MSLVEAERLESGYVDRRVLKGISFRLEPGERLALLGPNGSGKSTLLKTLALGVAVSTGQLRIDGEEIGRLRAADLARRVAYVPQEETAPFEYTVREIVTMGRLPRSRGLFDTAEDRRVADEAMGRTQCLHLAERPIGQLSGGERQRAWLARGLAQEATLLLLDEPTTHLDVAHQADLVTLLHEIGQAPRAIVVATHDLNFAASACRRAILLSEGEIALEGEIDEVLQSRVLDTVFAASFDRLTRPDGTVVVAPRLSGEVPSSAPSASRP